MSLHISFKTIEGAKGNGLRKESWPSSDNDWK